MMDSLESLDLVGSMSRSGAGQMEGTYLGQPNTGDQTTTSDEHIDPYCEICVEDEKTRIAAIGLCKECNTFVCQQCLKAHLRWPGMRDHKILEGDEMPRTQAEKPVKFPDCEIYKGNVKDHFCLDHHEMLCSQCIKSFHKTCRQTTILKLCETLDEDDVRKFRDLIQNVIGTAGAVKMTIQQKKDDIENQRKKIIKETEDLKKRLDTTVQSMTLDNTHITELCNDQTSVLDEQFESATTAAHFLQNDILSLDKFDGDIVTPNMFIAFQGMVKNAKAGQKQLKHVSNQLRDVRFSFIPNPALTHFLLSGNGIGEVNKDANACDNFETLPEINFPSSPPKTSESQCVEVNKRMHLFLLLAYIVVYVLIVFHLYGIGHSKPCNIFSITLTKKSSVDVVELLDWNVDIWEMFVTANGTLFVTVAYNNEVNAFTSDGIFLSSLSFSDSPSSIAFINATTAVVSTEDEKMLFLNISSPSDLSIQRSIFFGKYLRRLTIYDNKIIGIAWSGDGYSIKMLDFDGHEIWSTSPDSSGHPLFGILQYLITKVVNGTETVIVTDGDMDQIVFLDADDGKLFNTIDVKGKGPRGLAVDNEDNVYICYSKTSEISVWSPGLSQSRILLSNNRMQEWPYTIVYSKVTGELFISYLRSSIVDQFQVTCK